MSLPSGLLFYLDYTYGTDQGGGGDDHMYTGGESIYNNPTGKAIQSGSLGTGGQYDLLGSGYSRQHGSQAAIATIADIPTTSAEGLCFGTISEAGAFTHYTDNAAVGGASSLAGAVGRLVDFDAALASYLADNSGTVLGFGLRFIDSDLKADTIGLPFDLTMLQDLGVHTGSTGAETGMVAGDTAGLQGGTGILNLRRFTKRVNLAGDTDGGKITVDPLGGKYILFAFLTDGSDTIDAGTDTFALSGAVASSLDTSDGNGATLVIPSFEATDADGADPEQSPVIPEIDIKIESLAVTAVSRKLKAKWSPELAQDLNAYHSLDAEVELTQILSEQIALELDREVLNDLLTQANGANLFWSRAPGKFVNKLTGVEVPRNTSLRPGPQFTGTVRDWYETLVETIIDAANIIHRKTLRGSANFIVIGPDVATIFESSVMYKPSYSIDGQGQAGALSIGAEKIGSLSNRFTVYKDPYFPRNKVLVGYKGGSYLETGYVYAPYVPLIVTPTIFAPEDFTPRKGVMTRYGKKMVRSDFYGTVTCLDMNII